MRIIIPAKSIIEPGRLNNSHGFSYPDMMYLYVMFCVLFINNIVGVPLMVIVFVLLDNVIVVAFLWLVYVNSSVMFIGLFVLVISISVEFFGIKYDGRLGGLINLLVLPEFSSVFVMGIVEIIVKISPISATVRPSMNCLFLMNLILGILYPISIT